MRNCERFAFIAVLILQAIIIFWKISASSSKETANADHILHLARPLVPHPSRERLAAPTSSNSCIYSPIFIEQENPTSAKPFIKSLVELPPPFGKYGSQISIALTIPFVVRQLPQLRSFVESWISFPPCRLESADGYRFELFLYYSRTIEKETTAIQAEILVSWCHPCLL